MMSSPSKSTRSVEERFVGEVVLVAIELERQHVVGPAREGTSGLADITLRVVAHTHREQFEQLAAEVFVRVVLDVLTVVQIDEHRGIFQDPISRSRRLPDALLAEHPILLQHHPVVAHLVLTGGKVPVPEECQLFLERPPCREHAVRPPEAKALRLDVVGGQTVEKLVDHRLEPPRRTFRQELLAEPFTALTASRTASARLVGNGIHSSVPDPYSSNGGWRRLSMDS